MRALFFLFAATISTHAQAPTPFPTLPPTAPCNVSNNVIVEDLTTFEPQLVSVNLQDAYAETLFAVAVGDFFESSLYTDTASGSLVQRVYWRDSSPAQYTAENEEFRLVENVIINASRVVDVAAEAMFVEGRVLYAIATEDRLLQVYILKLPPAPLTNATIVALSQTRVNQTNCTASALHTLLIDVTCDWQLRDTSTPELAECFVFALECGVLHTYKVNVINETLDETSCVHDEYNYTQARSLQVEVAAFPFTSPTGVLLSHALVATMYTNSLNVTAPAWLFSTHLCQPAFPVGSSTISSTLDYFARSGIATDDSGAMIMRTALNSTTPLGAYRMWMLIPSPYYGNSVEFFDPIDRPGTLQSHAITSVIAAPLPVFIRRLAASNTDYSLHGVDALFVAAFYAPHTELLVGLLGTNGSVFRESIKASNSSYDSRQLSMGTVFEFDPCTRPLPLVAATLATGSGSDVLQFDFVPATVTSTPTASPTPSPTVSINQDPIRDRTDIPLPNSVIEGSVFRGRCANNTWVRPGADPHRDTCDPYGMVASNNQSQPLWFSFETQLEPAAYMIYTDPSSGVCANPANPEAPTHPASPIAGTVVSLWCHCFYNAPVTENGIDQCGNDPVPGMADDHGFIGPVCLNPDTMYLIRVRGDDTSQVGEFDINVEEWSLRRGGDRCPSARPLDHIVDGVNDGSNCESPVYTNLCAPPAGRDLAVKCPEIESQSVPTTWFSYETRSFGTGPAQLQFDVRFNDTRSMATIGTLPFNVSDVNLTVSFTLSLWRACETLLEEPLLCETVAAELDNGTLTFDFAPLIYSEPVNATFTSKVLRPHTTYYVAISTTYRGDFGICGREIQVSPDAAIPPGFPTPAPTPVLCSTEAMPGNCSCDETPCNASESLDAHLFVQRFTRPDFYPGQFGAAISENLTGVDIVAHGKACKCCMQPMIFDTANATGDDCELATPNRRFSGRGCGAGGAEGDGVNFRDLGLCLIVSEDGDSLDPDSLREAGVVLSVSFCATVQFEYIVLVNARKGTQVTLFDANGEDFPHIPLRDLGPNSVLNMSFNNPNYAPPFISKFEIEFGYGGACIVEFAYRVLGLNAMCGCADAPMPNVAPPANASAPGACCHSGGSQCTDYPAKHLCDFVQHGTWFQGRSCAEGTFCPNQHAGAGEIFGWQHDNTPIDHRVDLLESQRKLHRDRPPHARHEVETESSSSSSHHKVSVKKWRRHN